VKTERDPVVRHNWWWRRCSAIVSDSPEHWSWKDGQEDAAFAYECVRRLTRTLPSYLELDPFQRGQIVHKLGRTQHYYLWSADIDRPVSKANYSAAVRWNLRASDNALQHAFLKFIHAQRHQKGVTAGSDPVIRRKNLVSWRWLEVWDTNELDGRPMTSGERAMKTRAKKLAYQAEKSVTRALRVAAKEKISGFVTFPPV